MEKDILLDTNGDCLYEQLCVNGEWKTCGSNNEGKSYTVNSKTYYCRYNPSPVCPTDACSDFTDCQSKIKPGWEWVEKSKLGTEMTDNECKDSYDNDCDGKTDCEEKDCAGKQGPNGYICCQNNDDCKDAGVTCDNNNPPYPHRYAECENNECKRCGPCQKAEHCEDDFCCPYEIDNGAYVDATGDEQCKKKGTIINWNDKSYICDPPFGFSGSKESSYSFFDWLYSILNPFA